MFFFFKQKTAYEMRISDWSSDVCSSDLDADQALPAGQCARGGDLGSAVPGARLAARPCLRRGRRGGQPAGAGDRRPGGGAGAGLGGGAVHVSLVRPPRRLAAGASVYTAEHTSELQSINRLSYAAYDVKK